MGVLKPKEGRRKLRFDKVPQHNIVTSIAQWFLKSRVGLTLTELGTRIHSLIIIITTEESPNCGSDSH